MTTLYTDLQKLVHDHCDAVVCVNGSILAKDLRGLLEKHKDKQAATAGALSEAFLDAVILDICEIPDRDSPVHMPQGMIVTSEELKNIVRSNEEIFFECGKAIITPLKTAGEIDAANPAQVIALLDEIKMLTDTVHAGTEYIAQYRIEIAQLRAELEQAKKDADRYQWLRHAEEAEIDIGDVTTVFGGLLDDIIDAARAVGDADVGVK